MNELIPEKYREDEELIRLTIDQVKKDFGTQLSALEFSGRKEKLFDELASQVAASLKEIHASNPVLFKAILYKVDVSERDLKRLKDPNDFFRLAEAVIQREFKKVIIRRFFSG